MCESIPAAATHREQIGLSNYFSPICKTESHIRVDNSLAS